MISHSWHRSLSGLADFHDIVRDELQPWRDSVVSDCRTWSLTMTSVSIIVTSDGDGPFCWPELCEWTAAPVLSFPSPLEPLLHNLAADLTLTIAMCPVESWAQAVETIQTWPHRRRWRSRGGSRAFRSTRLTEPPPRSPVEPATDAAFAVVAIAATALPEKFAVDVEATWVQLARYVRSQLSSMNPDLAELSFADR